MAMARRSLLLSLHFSISVVLVCSQPLPQPTAPDVSVVLGFPAHLVCTVQGYTGTEPIVINVQKLSGTNSPSSTSLIQTDGNTAVTLSIDASSLEDAGTYVCDATIPESTTLTVMFNLNVRDELGLLIPPSNATTVTPGSTVAFSCVFNRDIPVVWLKDDMSLSAEVTKYSYSEAGGRRLSISNTTYAQMGIYTCRAGDEEAGRVIQAFANLSLVPAYVPLQREGSPGQSSVVTGETIRVRCPITGVPGPYIIFWQRGQITSSPNLTTEANSGNDPFIDSEGYLDFSKATPADTGHYRCTGVDERGEMARQVFFVTVSNDPTFVIWVQWYIILVYCVVGVAILVVIILSIWFCCTVKANLCVRVDKVVQKKEHVPRSASKRPFVFGTPRPRDEGIDAYAMNEYEESYAEAESYTEEIEEP